MEFWPASHDESSLDLWADWRGKIDDLSNDDVVILGSSRGHFDLNIHLWDSITGRRPVMLAYPGSSPFNIVEDVVENSNFKGLLIISVAPGLFYTRRGSWPANTGKSLVDHYNDRTYAQKFSGAIFQFVDPIFSYVAIELSLKNLINRLPFENRDSVDAPPIWQPMVTMDKYRNVRMMPDMETDTILQGQMKALWFNPDPKNEYADSIELVLGHYTDLIAKFEAKGGQVAFIRPPVVDYFLETETRLFPREKYWDRLLEKCGCKGYHYRDDSVSKEMIPPEWSHLNRKDSDTYTKIIIDLLKKDQLL